MTENSERDDRVAKALRETLAALPVGDPPALDVGGAHRLVAVANVAPRRWAVWAAAAAVTALSVGSIVAVARDDDPGSSTGDTGLAPTGSSDAAASTGAASDVGEPETLFLSETYMNPTSSITVIPLVDVPSNEVTITQVTDTAPDTGSADVTTGRDRLGEVVATLMASEPNGVASDPGVAAGDRAFIDLPALDDARYELTLGGVATGSFEFATGAGDDYEDAAPDPARSDELVMRPSLVTPSTRVVDLAYSSGIEPELPELTGVERWQGDIIAGGTWVRLPAVLPDPAQQPGRFAAALGRLPDGAYRLIGRRDERALTHFFVQRDQRDATPETVTPSTRTTDTSPAPTVLASSPKLPELTTTTASESPGTPPEVAGCSPSEAALRDKIEVATQGGFGFAGTVTHVEMRVHPDNDDPELTVPPDRREPMPWVTFDVERWYTTDWGTSFSVFMPGLDPQVGETWRVGGNAYYVTMDDFDGQSGEVDPCFAGPDADESTRAIWDDAFGGSVPTGSDEPIGTPDPDDLAALQAAQRMWRRSEPDSYSVVITYWTRETNDAQAPACSPNSGGSYRVVVIDGVATEAVDLQNLCRRDPATVLSVDDLFDEAIRVAGASEFSPHTNVEGGNPLSFYASDRSVEAHGNAFGVSTNTAAATFGWDKVLAEADDARQRWARSSPLSYRLTINTGGGERNAHDVIAQIDDDRVVELNVNGKKADPSTLELPWQPYTVDHVFDLIEAQAEAEWPGREAGDGSVVAVFDPDSGLPTDLWFDPVLNGVDDELEVHLRIDR